MQIHFHEKQKFTQWWIWLILIGIALIFVYGLYQQLILGVPFGDKPLSDVGLAVFSILMLGMLVFFWFLQLETEIDAGGIRVSFFPFVKKQFRWAEVRSAEVVDYGFVGGWGIRLSARYGAVYNVKGRKGLAIKLINGRKYCIGTQKENELRSVIAEVYHRGKR